MEYLDRLRTSVRHIALVVSLTLNVQIVGVGSDFLVLNNAMNRLTALSKCVELGYDGLAILDTVEAYKEAVDLIGSNHYEHWFGMKFSPYLGRHLHDTGDPLTWTQWDPNDGEPNTPYTDRCVRIAIPRNMRTRDCSLPYAAVCGNDPRYLRMLVFDWTDLNKSGFPGELWSGTVRSRLECLRRCAGHKQCRYIGFDKRRLFCNIISVEMDIEEGISSSMNTFQQIKLRTLEV